MHDWLTSEYRAEKAAEYERIRAKHPDLVTRSFECWTGWFPLLEEYFDTVAKLIVEHPGSTYSLQQVKEKFGGLRIYSGASADILDAEYAACRHAEDRAERTCDVCGREGVLRGAGWYATRCDDHADGATPTNPGDDA